MDKIKTAFFYQDALDINKARVEHLDKLGIDLKNKSILETGCGGIGDVTTKLLTYTDNITLNDARIENIEHLMDNINRRLYYNTNDLNEKCEGNYDVIFSVGTLYHLHKPAEAIKYMAQSAREMLILSTCTNGYDNGISFPREEGQNQSFTGTGCRPGRLWVKNELEKHFKYVYFINYSPRHSDFPQDWSHQPTNGLARFMMIGSHMELDNSNLTTELPVVYKDMS
tara:strand:+ start:1491 stop:2168 length:678 start_codon:yes stop_codon:yes gene_type:complete